MRQRGHRGWLAVGAIATVLALTGCSGASEQPENGTSSTEVEDTDDVAGGDAEVSGTVPDVDEPIATRTVTRDGNSYRLDVFPLVFDQGSPGVSVNLRLVFQEMAEPTVHLGLLASQEDQGSVRVRRASGLQVIDRKGGMAYLPARDAEGLPLCSPELPTSARDGDQVYVTCVFGGLADDVGALDLVVPTFGTFRDVSTE